MQTRQIRLPLPIDPELPAAFDSTPNDERSKAELDAWWDQPFLVTNGDGTLTARCLNGGSWDRSTALGRGTSVEDATVLALAAQAAWVKRRSAPIAQVDEGVLRVVIQPQRPDEEARVLAAGLSAEQAQAIISDAT